MWAVGNVGEMRPLSRASRALLFVMLCAASAVLAVRQRRLPAPPLETTPLRVAEPSHVLPDRGGTFVRRRPPCNCAMAAALTAPRAASPSGARAAAPEPPCGALRTLPFSPCRPVDLDGADEVRLILTTGSEPVAQRAGGSSDGDLDGGDDLQGIILHATGWYALGLEGVEEGGCLDPDATRTFLRRVEALPPGACAGAPCVRRPDQPRLLRVTRRVGVTWGVAYRADARAYLDAREQLIARSPTDAERVCRLLREGPDPPAVTYEQEHWQHSTMPWTVSGCVRADGWFLHERSGGADEGSVRVGRYDSAQVERAARWLRVKGWDHTRDTLQGDGAEPLCADGHCFDREEGLVFTGFPHSELE